MGNALKGSQYRARRRLSSKENVTLAEVGQTCERVPVESLPSLLASGKIAPVDDDQAPIAAPAAAPAAPAPPRRRKDEV